jgi:hypothetical protein
MVVFIIDLIALTSFQFAGDLGFAVANCDGLAVLFARIDWTEIPRRLRGEEWSTVPALLEIEAYL